MAGAIKVWPRDCLSGYNRAKIAIQFSKRSTNSANYKKVSKIFSELNLPSIESLADRHIARHNLYFATSDRIRAQLTEQNITEIDKSGSLSTYIFPRPKLRSIFICKYLGTYRACHAISLHKYLENIAIKQIDANILIEQMILINNR